MSHTILTVEDVSSFRRLIRMTLEFAGYEVIEADDGAQGLAIARARRPDLILLDVLMPGIDGLSLCEILNADTLFSSTPIVMLSSSDEQERVAAALAAGARAYLIKPFEPKQLIELVRRLIGEAKNPAGQASVG